MSGPVQVLFDRLKKAGVTFQNSFIASQNDIDDFGTDAYRRGFKDCKEYIVAEISEVIKDETLKGLLLKHIEGIGDYYAYLDR